MAAIVKKSTFDNIASVKFSQEFGNVFNFKQSGIEKNGWNCQGRSTIFRLSVKNSTASLISTKTNKTKRLKLSRSQRSTLFRPKVMNSATSSISTKPNRTKWLELSRKLGIFSVSQGLHINQD